VLRAMLVGLLVSVAVTALSRTGVLAGWETRAVDAFLVLRDRVPAPEIVLVLIDDDAFLASASASPSRAATWPTSPTSSCAAARGWWPSTW